MCGHLQPLTCGRLLAHDGAAPACDQLSNVFHPPITCQIRPMLTCLVPAYGRTFASTARIVAGRAWMLMARYHRILKRPETFRTTSVGKLLANATQPGYATLRGAISFA